MKRIVFTVTNDLSFDQRMDRICGTLADNGFRCKLVGRKRRLSLPLTPTNYKQVRIPCFFERGKLFYLEYNFKLFWYLLFQRADIYCAIDLDTILPALLCSKIRRKPLVYDAHEFFTEMEEIVSRPVIHRLWRTLERFAMKYVKHAYTISEGYAAMYKERYGIDFKVIRNVPYKQVHTLPHCAERSVIYQGSLNVGRGIEEAILAMPGLEGIKLVIYGDGPNAPRLRSLAKSLNLNGQIEFRGAVRPDELRKQTCQAWLGLTLFSETGLHHRHSLANRFFDYLNAGIPQIAMNYPEYQAFNRQYEVAVLIDDLRPEVIAEAVKKVYFDPVHYERMKENCSLAKSQHCWEKECHKLLAFYRSL